MAIVIKEFDGFRVEVNNEDNRGDIILSRPPLNVIQYSQRIQMAEAMKDLDKNENVRVIILRADGKNFSSKSIKEKIKKIVSSENKKSPFSDNKIKDILKSEGIDLARRTVSKYRESLNIESSSKRKI